jgi:hypothetical protein
MMKGDKAAERAGDKLDELAEKAAERGGIAAKLADTIADDASFVRKLKPSLIVARAKGDAPRDQEPGTTRPAAPSRPQLGSRASSKDAGRNPFAVAGAAFAVGTLLAKIIDWRGHAHPRR